MLRNHSSALRGDMPALAGAAAAWLLPTSFSAAPGVAGLSYALAAVAVLALGALAVRLARRHRELQRALNLEKRSRSAITDSLVEGLCVCDAQGRAQLVNQAAEQMLGWKADELHGHMLHDRIHRFHPDGRPYPASDCPILKVLQNGTSLRVEDEVFTHRDGRLIPISYSVAPMRDPDGRIIGLVLAFSDLTGRMRAEQARSQLAAIVNASGDVIFAKTLDGIVTSWNQGAERVYGYTAAEIVGRPVALLAPPEVRDTIPGILERVARGEIVQEEVVRMRKDGERIDVALTVSPVYDDRGRIALASTVARDITEQKRAREELRRSLREFRLLYESGRTLGETLDPAQVFRSMRELVCSALPCDGLVVSSYAPDEQIIRCTHAWVEGTYVDPAKFPPIRINPERRGMQSRVIATGEPLLVPDVAAYTREPGTRYHYVDPDGTVHDRPTDDPHSQSALMVPITLEGRVLGVAQLFSNQVNAYQEHDLRLFEALVSQMGAASRNAALYAVSQQELEHRRSIEAALRASEGRYRDLAQTLEQRVRERTTELEATNEQLVEFAYHISHDLRSPVRAIRGYLDAMVEDFGDRLAPEAREHSRKIVEATERMDRLIQDLLAYSRMGKAELIQEPVKLHLAVKAAVAQAGPELSQDDGDLRIVVDERLPEVAAHAATLEQVIWNLIANAFKFVAPERRPQVMVRAERRGECVRLWVEDNGIGIAAEHYERIFMPFERLHHRAEYAGTGIGLAMVKRAIERMGGMVGVESAPGVGSRFWIELPLAAAVARRREHGSMTRRRPAYPLPPF